MGVKRKNENFLKNVFRGEKGVFEYLRPGSMGPTPIVELPKELNPFCKDKVRIFIKLLEFVPLTNIKSLPSFEMLEEIPKNKISKIKNLVEYSSGNTVLSLTILSKHFGIPNMHAIITPDVPEHKKRLLRLVGSNILISHGPPSPGVFDTSGGIYDAKIMGGKSGWHNLNQYVNKGNPEASRKYLGEELFDQLGKELSIFTASIGTGGTITGSGDFLKKKIRGLKVIGATIKNGSSIPGPRGEIAIHHLGIPWEKVVNDVVAVDTKNAYKMSLDLIRLGLFVGPSTGMQLYALLKKLGDYKKNGELKKLRNKNGEIVCIFTACDTMFAYIDDYFSVLPSKYFPKVKNI